MQLSKFENMICDVLWDLKKSKVYMKRSESLYYINTFERLNKEGNGVEITLYDGTKINLQITFNGHKSVDINSQSQYNNK